MRRIIKKIHICFFAILAFVIFISLVEASDSSGGEFGTYHGSHDSPSFFVQFPVDGDRTITQLWNHSSYEYKVPSGIFDLNIIDENLLKNYNYDVEVANPLDLTMPLSWTNYSQPGAEAVWIDYDGNKVLKLDSKIGEASRHYWISDVFPVEPNTDYLYSAFCKNDSINPLDNRLFFRIQFSNYAGNTNKRNAYIWFRQNYFAPIEQVGINLPDWYDSILSDAGTTQGRFKIWGFEANGTVYCDDILLAPKRIISGYFAGPLYTWDTPTGLIGPAHPGFGGLRNIDVSLIETPGFIDITHYSDSDYVAANYHMIYDNVSKRIYEWGYFDVKANYSALNSHVMMSTIDEDAHYAKLYNESGDFIREVEFVEGFEDYSITNASMVLFETDNPGSYMDKWNYAIVADKSLGWWTTFHLKDLQGYNKFYLNINKSLDGVDTESGNYPFRGFTMWAYDTDLTGIDQTIQDVVTHNNEYSFRLHPSVNFVSSSRQDEITTLNINVNSLFEDLSVRVENNNSGEDAYDYTDKKLISENFDKIFSVDVDGVKEIKIAKIDKYVLVPEENSIADIYADSGSLVDESVLLSGLYPSNIPMMVDSGVEIHSSETQVLNANFDSFDSDFMVLSDVREINQQMSLVYNPSDNFIAKDNNVEFARVESGILSFSNPEYVVGYNSSSGLLSFAIPTMSLHNVEIVPIVVECNEADVDLDGFVGGDDLSIIMTNWGIGGATRQQGDTDGDGFVGGTDYSNVLTHWGQSTEDCI